MKKYYEKTRLDYTVIPAILLLYASIVLMICYDSNEFFNIILIMHLGYLLLFLLCVGRTIKERREFNEIITYGRCVDGIVKEIVLVLYETSFSRAGNPTESSRYQIKVETKDGGGSVLHTYYSDLVRKRAIRHIPKKVLVYDYMGKICIVWEKSKIKESFHIEKGIDIQKGNGVRMTFNYATGIFLIMYTGITGGVIIDLLA